MNPQQAGAIFERAHLSIEKLVRQAKQRTALAILSFYLQEIVDGKISPHAGMCKIDDLNQRQDSRSGAFTYPDPLRRPDRSVKHKFVGDQLGVEYLYTWWRELKDAREGGLILHYTDRPLDEAIMKFEQHIVDEAEKRLAQLMDGGPRR